MSHQVPSSIRSAYLRSHLVRLTVALLTAGLGGQGAACSGSVSSGQANGGAAGGAAGRPAAGGARAGSGLGGAGGSGGSQSGAAGRAAGGAGGGSAGAAGGAGGQKDGAGGAGGGSSPFPSTPPGPVDVDDLVPLVDVNATTPHGPPFFGASVPFGMMMWGPNGGFQRITGYGLTALSGAEIDGHLYGHVAIRPAVKSPADLIDGPAIPQTSTGHPALFKQTLDGIGVELTTTVRTGMGRFTFPAGAQPTLLFQGESFKVDMATGRVTGHDGIVQFVVEVDRPIAGAQTFNDHGVLDANVSERGSGLALKLQSGSGPVLIRVGMSYVSLDGAIANLSAESTGWDFDKMVDAGRAAWNEALSRVKVTGGTAEQRGMFYSALHRTFFQPNTASDVDGKYRGFDNVVHSAPGFTAYYNFSIWDTYRTWVQLVAWLFPDRVSDMIQSLVNAAKEGGGGMPRWVANNRDTGVMEEGSATPFVASAYAFGARKFDTAAAWTAMDKVESVVGTMCTGVIERPDLADYLKYGFVPQGDTYTNQRGATMTLEYAIGDFSLAQFSAAIGKTADAARYLKLAQNWRNVFNPASGWMQTRNADGSWWKDAEFSPAHGHFIGFTEGNSAQYTWMVPFDMAGLFEAMGGKDKAVAKLDDVSKELNAGQESDHLWMGNEPSFGAPSVYAWTGQPWKGQQVVRRVLREVWGPGTLPGADDLGAMSAWYVWGAIGLYPAIPGVGGWVLTSPIFDTVTLSSTDGRQLRIEAKDAATGDYIQSVTIGGQPYTSPWLPISRLGDGQTTIQMQIGAQPNMKWGVADADAPPSFRP